MIIARATLTYTLMIKKGMKTGNIPWTLSCLLRRYVIIKDLTCVSCVSSIEHFFRDVDIYQWRSVTVKMNHTIQGPRTVPQNFFWSDLLYKDLYVSRILRTPDWSCSIRLGLVIISSIISRTSVNIRARQTSDTRSKERDNTTCPGLDHPNEFVS